MKQELEQIIATVVKDVFDVEATIVLTRPDPQFGDFATNIALQLAKQVGDSPRAVAQKICDKLKHEVITQTSIAGPGFINISISSDSFAKELNGLTASELTNFGRTNIGEGKSVVCEFPSPNMAKPFSVGHIRSATQGWAVSELHKRHGYTVITDNHLGDYGTPFGKWVVGFLRYSSGEALEKNGIYELSRVYIQITADLKKEKLNDDSEIANEVQSWLTKLESGDQKAVAFKERFSAISLQHMHHVLQRLNIQTEHELGESFYVERGQQLVEELLKKGVAKTSDGAVIVELDSYNIETPVMLRKANGAALYATSDLATVEYREKTWQPEKVFIHTGGEQTFYFQQLKALSRECGYKDVIHHLWHGLVDQISEDGKREKMSSRKGVVLLEELLDVAIVRAKEVMKFENDEDAKAVALAAVKFTDFTADRKKGILFDWDSMFNVQGFSGPAVQYAAVRIKSILQKAGQNGSYSDKYDWAAEHKLLVHVLRYPDLLLELEQTYEMHKLAAYLYDLSRELNRYYENVRVLESENPEKSARLWLLSVVGFVLSDGLDILGIPTPNKM